MECLVQLAVFGKVVSKRFTKSLDSFFSAIHLSRVIPFLKVTTLLVLRSEQHF